jgi:hypothetical protein
MNTTTKKYVYLGVWLVLGGMLGFLLSEFTELLFIYKNEQFENRVEIYGLIILAFVGIAAILGPIAWRKIYVEGLRGKKYVAKN